MKPFEDDRLAATLESLRPIPRPDFTAELDERVAAGFPRRSRGSALGRLIARLRAMGPRRALIPAGAMALAAAAAVTVVVAIGQDETGTPSSGLLSLTEEEHFAAPEGDTASPPMAEGNATGATAAGAELLPPGAEPHLDRAGPYASRASKREIERSAEMVLATEPAGVRRAASEVFETVHAHRGIVLSSSIRDGAEGEAGARFELLIPSARLGDALAAFSGIAEVRSRHETTADITAPTARTGEQLRDSRAKIDSLLAELSQSDTEAERTAVEAQLRGERRHNAYLRSQLSSLRRRANLSHVSLQVETGAASTSPDETGGWGVGDALGDAGDILAIAAGVAIVGLAVLGPIALIALLAWLANRARIHRARARALA
jgi:hypothetical protein